MTDRIFSARLDSPEARPLIDDLRAYYGELYADYEGFEHEPDAPDEIDLFPAEMFIPPFGGALLLARDGELIAGGAFMYLDDETAEIKRVWTSPAHRGEGLSRVIMAALEEEITTRGYRFAYLSTGPRQPAAKTLYLSLGYIPLFDVAADPETIGDLPFEKELAPGNRGVRVDDERAAARQRELLDHVRRWRSAPEKRLREITCPATP